MSSMGLQNYLIDRSGAFSFHDCIYRWAWVALIAATIVTFAVMIIYPSHHELAADNG